MKILSLFSGAGGLDLGFSQAGFEITWANEYDSSVYKTYRLNHPNTVLREGSIVDVRESEIPDADGIIGGPPCQPWSLAGAMKGFKDPRGEVIKEYLRFLKIVKPKFFVFENVAGLVSKAHKDSYLILIEHFKKTLGYNVFAKLVNAHDYGVPQDRRRVIVIGFRDDIAKKFEFPNPLSQKLCLRDAIWDLRDIQAMPARGGNKANTGLPVANHEYYVGSFSTIFMSRNRIRKWEEPSFTIQASGRHAPLHPSCPQMKKVGTDCWAFTDDEGKYRRLTVREAARIQTFPDSFVFHYESVDHGYKMVGNAVPVKLAFILARSIRQHLAGESNSDQKRDEYPLLALMQRG